MKKIIVLLFFLLPSYGHALSLEANVFYFTDSLKRTSERTSTSTIYDIYAIINLDKKGRYFTGWSYGSVGYEVSGTTSTSFSSSEMGPLFGWHITKSQNWVLLAVYNLINTGTYQQGSTNEEWRGSSYKAAFGYKSFITESLMTGFYLNYYTASYAESLVGSTTFSTVSYAKSNIYPSFTMGYKF